ncbi:unnamed protein product [Didymodactylos carnosus]|uniref:Uncharacterized protein n=1 Tax=Didymodactylos carnosus TaxID=1234261 RepID=A0A8S2Q932_9BILA|nr:unnamed protein product [Didymodactylos carnosus]CAF4091925.1 unnamed protein product [Didymodactylos carnosus]
MNTIIINVENEVQNVASTLKSSSKSYINNATNSVNNILKSTTNTSSQLISKLREPLTPITQFIGSLAPVVANLETAFTNMLGNDFSGRLSSLIGILKYIMNRKSLEPKAKFVDVTAAEHVATTVSTSNDQRQQIQCHNVRQSTYLIIKKLEFQPGKVFKLPF